MAAPKKAHSKIEIVSELAFSSERAKLAAKLGKDFNEFHPVIKVWPPKSGSVSRPQVITKFAPADRDLGYELAAALRAKAEVEQERSEANSEFKARLEALQTTINMLQHDILTGQKQLPLEM